MQGIARAAHRVRQFVCGLHGHDALLQFGHSRLSLRCASCGYESPGWELKGARPRARSARIDRDVVRQLSRARRVA